MESLQEITMKAFQATLHPSVSRDLFPGENLLEFLHDLQTLNTFRVQEPNTKGRVQTKVQTKQCGASVYLSQDQLNVPTSLLNSRELMASQTNELLGITQFDFETENCIRFRMDSFVHLEMYVEGQIDTASNQVLICAGRTGARKSKICGRFDTDTRLLRLDDELNLEFWAEVIVPQACKSIKRKRDH